MDKSQRKGSTKRLIFGLVLGLTTGAITAILLAPDSGANLRRLILGRSTAIREQGLSSYITLSHQLQERYSEALAESRAAYERAKQELSNRYSRAKSGQL
jgi:gas vesicle protein